MKKQPWEIVRDQMDFLYKAMHNKCEAENLYPEDDYGAQDDLEVDGYVESQQFDR